MSHQTPITRRRLLSLFGVGGAGLALALSDRLPGRKPESATVRVSDLLMGTVVTVQVVTEDTEGGKSAITEAFKTMRRLVGIFDRRDSASPLARLNSWGSLDEPAPELVALLRQAEAVSLASQGAFDASVLPLVNLYAGRSGLPSRQTVRATLERVGHSGVRCAAHSISFDRPGMGVTLDGIAKGAVIDAGLRTLQERGFANALVEAGGDLVTSGTNPAGGAWRIGLRPPRAGLSSPLPRLAIGDRAVATSGDYLQAYVSDFSAHHLLDPRRGVSPAELASITVVAPSAARADALATALMVTGLRGGLSLLESYPDCDALLLDKQMRMVRTPGFASWLV